MKYIKIITIYALFAFLGIGTVAFALTQNFENIQPFVDNTYSNGTSSKAWGSLTTNRLFVTGSATTTFIGDIMVGNSSNGAQFTVDQGAGAIKLQANNYTAVLSGALLVGTTVKPPFGNKLTVSGGCTIGQNYTAVLAPTDGCIFAGNVGIGTTSPSAQLSIAGLAGGTSNVFVISTSTNTFATKTAFSVDAKGVTRILQDQASTTLKNQIAFASSTNGNAIEIKDSPRSINYYRTYGSSPTRHFDRWFAAGAWAGGTTASVVQVASTTTFVPWVEMAGGTIDGVSVDIANGVAAGNVQCSLYTFADEGDPYPYKLIQSWIIPITAASARYVASTSLFIPPNTPMLSGVYSTTTPTIRGLANAMLYPLWGASWTAISNLGNSIATTTGAANAIYTMPQIFPSYGNMLTDMTIQVVNVPICQYHFS